MPEPVICNSSCLIALEGIRRLDILEKLYGKVVIPEAVKEEFGVELPPWIQVEKVKNKEALSILLLELEKGEAEALVLASEKEGSTLVLDDKKARRIAAELGLKFTGTLGILIKAKKEGILSEVRPVLEEIEKRGFRISEALKEKVLKIAGEE